MGITEGLTGALCVTCSKCTRQKLYRAPTKYEAGQLAFKAGWVLDGDKFVCPKCPAVRVSKYDKGEVA